MGLPFPALEFRDKAANLKTIKRSKFASDGLSGHLKTFYSGKPSDKIDLEQFAKQANERFIPPSRFKELALKYSEEAVRLKDPQGYRSALIELTNSLVPKDLNTLPKYLDLKSPIVEQTILRPATGKETGEVYGAVTQITKQSDGKYLVEVIVSNNESEPIPYLIPLVIHELQHANGYEQKPLESTNPKQYYEYLLVDEAVAFDLQMKSYVALASKAPDLFCNWIYVTWSYGELPVPLSWVMAEMEREMERGVYIFNYARMGTYKDLDYLLNDQKTALRNDIQKYITDLKLKYVR